jgi:hypothetical protein
MRNEATDIVEEPRRRVVAGRASLVRKPREGVAFEMKREAEVAEHRIDPHQGVVATALGADDRERAPRHWVEVVVLDIRASWIDCAVGASAAGIACPWVVL